MKSTSLSTSLVKKSLSALMAFAIILTSLVLPVDSHAASTQVGSDFDGKMVVIKVYGKNHAGNVQYRPTGVQEANVVCDPIYDGNGTNGIQDNETWKFTYVPAYGAYYITVQYDSGLSLNSKYGRDCPKGSQVKVYRTNSSDTASLWRVYRNSNGSCSLQNVASGYWLDLDGGRTNPGTRLNNWVRDTQTNNQSFDLVKIGGTTAAKSVGSALNGKSVIFRSRGINAVMNVQYRPSGVTEANVVADPIDDGNGRQDNEIWYLTYVPAYDAYYITIKYDRGLSLNSKYGAGAAKGSQICVYRTNSSDLASLWRIYQNSDGSYSLQNVASGFWVDLDGGRGAAGTRYNNWVRDTKNQFFDIITVGTTSSASSSSSSSSSFDPVWPCTSKTVNCLYRYSDGDIHSTRYGSGCGIDIGAPKGEAVVAVESGTVIEAGYSTDSGFGNYIKVQHPNGYTSLYAHLSKITVNKGNNVSRGQKIGEVGNTSAKYKNLGYHLHFEMGVNDTPGKAVDTYQLYYKNKYSLKLQQAAAKYNTPLK